MAKESWNAGESAGSGGCIDAKEVLVATVDWLRAYLARCGDGCSWRQCLWPVAMSPLLSGDDDTDVEVTMACLIGSEDACSSHWRLCSVATVGRAAGGDDNGIGSEVALGAGRGAGPLMRIERGTSPQPGPIR